MGKQVISELENGQKVYNFNPASDIPDAQGMNETCKIVRMQKGLTLETAQRRAQEKDEVIARRMHYTEYVPCVACCNCVIVRENMNGELENTIMACRMLRRTVSRYGTCDYGNVGKGGPMVIERDALLQSVKENKSKLIN